MRALILCRLYYTKEDRVEEAARKPVEDTFPHLLAEAG